MSSLKKSLMLLCFVLSIFFATTSKVSAAPSTLRLAGNDRYETSLKISQDGWSQSNYVVLVSGENYPDGLSAAPLAKKYNAPILLTDSNGLTASIREELQRLDVQNVFIIGGPTVISSNVENQLNSLNINSTRIYGQDRYETSVKIAKLVGSNNGIFITSGENFPDALSVSSIAAMKQMPILFTTSQNLPTSVKNYILNSNIDKCYVVGGTGAISSNGVSGLPNLKRLSGSDRYETNLSVINEFINDVNFNNVYIASGENFPDALSGSAAAAKNSAPIILTDDNYSKSTSIIKSKLNSISALKVLGGNAIVSSTLVRNILSTSTIVLGYDSGDNTGYNTIQNYSKYIDEVATDTFNVDGIGNIGGTAPADEVNYLNANSIQAMAMINNNFDANIARNILENPSNRERLINNLASILKSNNYKGVKVDIENIYSYDRSYFTTFMQELYNTLSPLGFEISVDVPAKTSDTIYDEWIDAYDYAQIAKYSDEITLMAYDEHCAGGSAGPIASIGWVQSVLDYATTVIPKEKILLGIAAYAYDWPSNGEKATAYSINEAYSIASKYGAAIKFDDNSKSPYFNYTDSSGIYHSVWLENSTSIGYKLDLVNEHNLSGIAMWKLGLESSDFWATISTKLNK
jgi:spore germination protein YaaH